MKKFAIKGTIANPAPLGVTWVWNDNNFIEHT